MKRLILMIDKIVGLRPPPPPRMLVSKSRQIGISTLLAKIPGFNEAFIARAEEKPKLKGHSRISYVHTSELEFYEDKDTL